MTTDIDDANEFCRSLRAPVRYSPLTQSSRYRIQTETDREQLAALSGSLPLHLTEWVEGRAVDAFVVRSEVLFVDQNGQISDESSKPIARYCVEIADALGLAFCKLSVVPRRTGTGIALVSIAPRRFTSAPAKPRSRSQGLLCGSFLQ